MRSGRTQRTAGIFDVGLTPGATYAVVEELLIGA
jgi:hypothetical protein